MVGIVLVAVAVGTVIAVIATTGGGAHEPTTSSAAAPPGQVIAARNGTISLALPAGWRGSDVSSGVEGLGPALFPDNPEAASTLGERLKILPRAVVLFGVRPPRRGTPPSFVDNVNVLADPTAPVSLSLEQIGPAEAKGIGQFAKVTDQGEVKLGARNAYRIIYTTPASSGVAYIIKGTQDTWVLTYSFGSSTADVDLAESSATTFKSP